MTESRLGRSPRALDCSMKSPRLICTFCEPRAVLPRLACADGGVGCRSTGAVSVLACGGAWASARMASIDT